jgi:hypothetical protein
VVTVRESRIDHAGVQEAHEHRSRELDRRIEHRDIEVRATLLAKTADDGAQNECGSIDAGADVGDRDTDARRLLGRPG